MMRRNKPEKRMLSSFAELEEIRCCAESPREIRLWKKEMRRARRRLGRWLCKEEE
jgi:hypothetical protein